MAEMKITFYKYHGAGNDFVVIDERSGDLHLTGETIRDICNRHFGVGADGLLLLRNISGYDFEMVYFNSDGRLASMCGNGSRCITAFAHHSGIITGNQARFIAADGQHEARILSISPMIISVKMGDVVSIADHGDHFFLDTGSPHYIKFVKDADAVDVVSEGRKIRNSETFRKEGTNVNFVQLDGNTLYVRTYERGVEDETLSCGTGVIASALAAVRNKIGSFPGDVVPIRTRGGDLKVSFNIDGSYFRNIWLEGPAEMVFKGEWEF